MAITEHSIREELGPGQLAGRHLWSIMAAQRMRQEGLAARIREHLRLGQLAAPWIDASAAFERMAPTPFSTVCFRAHPGDMDDEAQLDALNERLLQAINAAGRFFLSQTWVQSRLALRLAVGNLRTTEQVVRETCSALQAALVAVRSAPSPGAEAAAWPSLTQRATALQLRGRSSGWACLAGLPAHRTTTQASQA